MAKSIDTPFPSSPLVLGPVSVSWNRLFVFVGGADADCRQLRPHQPHQARQGHARHLPGPRDGRADGRRHQLHPHRHVRAGLRAWPPPPARCSGPVFVVYPTMGDLASLKAFAIVILGGLGSIPGATIGGFILAFMEELGAGYVSSGFRDGMGFLLIIVILIFKPTGLFAQKERIG